LSYFLLYGKSVVSYKDLKKVDLPNLLEGYDGCCKFKRVKFILFKFIYIYKYKNKYKYNN